MTFRVFHLLQRAHAALYRATDRHLARAHDVTATQIGLLFVLSQDDGQTIGAAARELGVALSSLSGLVDRMSARGLVRRGANDEDARSARLWLEPAGRRLAEAAAGEVKLINARILRNYTPQECEIIQRFLTDISANADALVGGAAQSRKRA